MVSVTAICTQTFWYKSLKIRSGVTVKASELPNNQGYVVWFNGLLIGRMHPSVFTQNFRISKG